MGQNDALHGSSYLRIRNLRILEGQVCEKISMLLPYILKAHGAELLQVFY